MQGPDLRPEARRPDPQGPGLRAGDQPRLFGQFAQGGVFRRLTGLDGPLHQLDTGERVLEGQDLGLA
ncbi:hypothetical protein D3C80_2161190 [compost metagenome]